MLRIYLSVLFFSLVLNGPTLTAESTTVSSTTAVLEITPNSGQVTAGEMITLTAKVSANNVPVTKGLVVFCKKDSPDCRDAAILGKSQLTNKGTATIKLVLGVGSYQVSAVFRGTPHSEVPLAASVSPLQTITVKPRTMSRSIQPNSVSRR
jgi:hypothetical protein